MNVETTPNPKCTKCKCYWVPDETDKRTSGLLFKTCKKCRENNVKYQNKNRCEHNKLKKYCKECDGSSLCCYEKCLSIAKYNIEGLNKGLYCCIHSDADMVNVVCSRCIQENCSQEAIFNTVEGIGRLYCRKHKAEGMINKKHKVCKVEGCINRAIFRFKDTKPFLYCHLHKEGGMEVRAPIITEIY